MEEHYDKIRRGETDIVLIAGNAADRLSGLDPLFQVEPGFNVLDIGCHEGFILERLVRCGAGVIHGVDLHRPSLAAAARRLEGHPALLKHLDLCEGMAGLRRELPVSPRYDLLLYLGIHHHMARQMPADALSAFVNELFPLTGRYLAIRTPARFMEVLRQEPVMRRFRLVHRHDQNPNLSPVEIYEPI